MKKITKLAGVLIFFISLMFINPIYVNAEYTYLDNTDYIIDKYDINVKVNKNNSYDVKENITVNFKEKKHGIVRTIPLVSKSKRHNGQIIKTEPIITKIKTNDKKKIEILNSNLSIKLGDEDIYNIGKKQYNISYRYDLGKDKLSGNDEFYFNIIGNEWDTLIKNVSFKIELPKDFKIEDIKFLEETYSESIIKNIQYKIKDNIITGEYFNPDIKKNFAIRVIFPEGTYKNTIFNKNIIEILFIILPLLLTIIIIRQIIKTTKNKKIEKIYNFYPPNNMNPLDLAVAYKGKLDVKDIMSLLFVLVNKGYIKIINVDDTGRFKKQDFKIRKIKEYDGTSEIEKNFFNSLFECATLDISKNEVTSKELENSFYKEISKILTLHKYEINKIEGAGCNFVVEFFAYIISFFLVIFTSIPFMVQTNNALLFFVFFGLGLFVPILFLKFFMRLINMENTEFLQIFLFPFFGFLVFYLVPSIYILSNYGVLSRYFISSLLTFICAFVITLFRIFRVKRRDDYIDLSNKILGFRDTINKANSDEISNIINSNPNYFYDVLPYVYVLGIEDKFIRKLSKFYNNTLLSNNNFLNELDLVESVKNLSTIISKKYSNLTYNSNYRTRDSFSSGGSSSGSSSSSGGFSSGGSGGGGGHSW